MTEVKCKLAYIQNALQRFYELAKTSNNLGDSSDSKLIETPFCRELLPIILHNCQFEMEVDICNRKAFDLIDNKNKCVYQITTTTSYKQKIKETISKFETTEECVNGYSLKIVFFRPLDPKEKTTETFATKFHFDNDKDIWDLVTLNQFIRDKGVDAINDCETLCKKYIDEHCGNKNIGSFKTKCDKLPISDYFIPRLVRCENTDDTLFSLTKAFDRIVLLGGAGSGKTVELKNLFNLLNESEVFQPFIFELKNYDGGDFEKIIPENMLSNKNVVLLFDAYDEIGIDSQNLSGQFVKALNRYCCKYEDAKVVVSSRLNFYNFFNDGNQDFLGFRCAYIMDFEENQILKYVKMRLKSEAGMFLNIAKKTSAYSYFYSPFYLLSFVNLFLERKRVPEKHELMRLIFESAFEKDKSKLTGLTNKAKKETLFNTLAQIALVQIQLGLPELDETDLISKIGSESVNNLKNFSLISYENEKFTFIHNNFKEYFAAYELLKFDEKDLAEYVSIKIVDASYIKPKYYNVMSFLLDFKKDDVAFIKLLFLIGKEILVNSDNIIDAKSELVLLRNILTEYGEKGSWIDAGRYNASLLAKHVSSPVAMDFLLQCLDIGKHRTTLITVMAILKEVKCCYGKEAELIKAVKTILEKTDETKDSHLVNRCLVFLANSKINCDFAKSLYLKYSLSEYSTVRAGANCIVYKKQLGDVFIDSLLKEKKRRKFVAKCVEDDLDDEDIQDSGERYYIQLALKEVNQHDALVKWGNYILTDGRRDSDREDSRLYFEKLLAQETLSGSLKEVVYNSLLLSARFLLRNCKDVLRGIIIKFGLQQLYFGKLAISTVSIFEKIDIYPLLFNESTAENMLHIFQKKKDYYEQADRFVTSLSWYQKEDIERWLNYFNKNNVPCKIQVDYTEIKRKELEAESFQKLFDEKLTKDEIRKIFQFKQNKPFRYKEIEKRLLRESSDFVGNYFRRSEEYIFTIEELDKANLIEFRIANIYEMLHDKNASITKQDQVDILQDWVNSVVGKFSFRNAITYTGEYSSKICPYAIYCSFFIIKHGVRVPQNIYEDMVYFHKFYDFLDGEFDLMEFLERKIGKELLIKNVCVAVNSGLLQQEELVANINYCAKHKINEVKTTVFNLLVTGNKTIHFFGARRSLIEYLIETHEIDNSLYFYEKFDLETKKEIFEFFVQNRNTKIISFVEKDIKKNSDESIYFAEKSLVLGSEVAFKYYINWIKSNKKFYSTSDYNPVLESLDNVSNLRYIFEMMELSYELNIKRKFKGPLNCLVNSLSLIASKSIGNLKMVVGEFGKYIRISKNKDMSYYHWSIENIVLSFLKNNPDI